MRCERINLAGGGFAIVCGSRDRRRIHRCCCGRGELAGLQCDWKMGGGKTCDRWISSVCALEVGPDKHLCPEHQLAAMAWALL